MRVVRAIAASLFVMSALSAAQAQPQAAVDDAPLWFYQTHFPVGLEGELTVTRDSDRWRAAIGGAEAEAAATGGNVRIDFQRDGAVFRGVIGARGELERAYWARREMTDDPRYTEGAAQAYAMPLTLRTAGRNRWRATVAPLENPFTLYLNIFRDQAGALKAAIRNPEHNRHGPTMLLDVKRDGDALRFSAPDSDKGALDARFQRGADRIEMYWAGIKRTLSMARATQAQRASFAARPPGEPRYVYRVPRDSGDGWRIARARDLGVDEAGLERAVHWITDIDPSSQRAWMVHSIAVAYRGRLILDEYFYGNSADIPHDMRSASKTLSSVIVGAAMSEGANISPQTRLYEAMAPLGPFANPDPRKERITLAHVMTHTTGLACDDNAEDPISPGNEALMQSQRAQPNWWKFTLDLPMEYEPGKHYAYCSGGISLAGGVLTMATGEWLPALFDRTVARPLRFGSYYWNLMPNGEGYAGGGAMVRTRDFLKIGQAYLDGGIWNGRRIVSEEWVRESLLAHVQISPETTGVSGSAFTNNYFEVPEGYAWHHIWVRSGERRYQAYHGNGNGGQLLLIVPEFDLAVMFTAGNYRTELWNIERDAIVGNIIIPALNHARQ